MTRREKLGKFLKAQRKAAGVTQRQIAEALGYSSAQFISNWERGISQPPLESLEQLAKLIKVDARKLLRMAVHNVGDRFRSD